MWGGEYGRLTSVNGLYHCVSSKYFAFLFFYLPVMFILKQPMYSKNSSDLTVSELYLIFVLPAD